MSKKYLKNVKDIKHLVTSGCSSTAASHLHYADCFLLPELKTLGIV